MQGKKGPTHNKTLLRYFIKITLYHFFCLDELFKGGKKMEYGKVKTVGQYLFYFIFFGGGLVKLCC